MCLEPVPALWLGRSEEGNQSAQRHTTWVHYVLQVGKAWVGGWVGWGGVGGGGGGQRRETENRVPKHTTWFIHQ